MTKKTTIQLKLDPNKPESKFKLLGGGKMSQRHIFRAPDC